MIYYFNCDGDGLDSVQGILNAHEKEIYAMEVGTYAQFDGAIINKVLPKLKKSDTVIVDTLDGLAALYRADAKLGTDATQSLWDQRPKYLNGDKNGWGAYSGAGETSLRHLKNCRSVGAKIIVLCHEAERQDDTMSPPIKKRAPDLNDQLRGNLVGTSSDVFRLKVLYEDIYNDDGEIALPKGARLLELQQNEESTIKYHVGLDMVDRIPPLLSRPSITKLARILGKEPSFLTVYGPPGVGKTTFALSNFLDPDGNGMGK